MLNMIKYGTPSDTPPLLIAHGLFGSARNWGVVARRLADTREVVTVDMRNHAASNWQASHSYFDMANDLAEVCASLGGPVDVMGHSMGGKAAMALALTHPDLLHRLIVADIAPVTYSHSQIKYIDAMRATDLSQVRNRADAAEQLRPLVGDPALVAFLLQSLDVSEQRWRLNLDVLASEMPKILSFPTLPGHFDGPTLMLSGEQSDYVLPEHRKLIKPLFPHAQFMALKGAGHWLHADQPQAFVEVVRGWLEH